MAESTVVRTKRDITIAITDGSSTYTVAYEPGDLSVDIPRFDVLNILDRGAMPATPSIRKGDDQPITFSFTAHERDIYSNTDATLMDLATEASGSDIASNWTSTIGSSSDLTTWTVNITIEGSDFGGSDVTMQLTFCVIRSRSDGDPNTISISGTAYIRAPSFS